MAADDGIVVSRPKRVRTASLVGDEGTPDCQNCRKSSRICKRGVRLNFIDIQTEQPPVLVPISHPWRVEFQDESIEIASEYEGGIGRYTAFSRMSPPKPTRNSPPTPRQTATVTTITSAPAAHPPLPPILPFPSAPARTGDPLGGVGPLHRQAYNPYAPTPPLPPPPPPTMNPESTISPAPKETRGYLNDPEETLFMQVFVEEVGIWMDNTDPCKHFSRLLPFSSLHEPMLLNAFLACGARHLTLVNPVTYHEDKALHYYDTATRLLLDSLRSPDRDIEMCATAAVVLNVYEIMSERAIQRMNHIAGARALLQECNWNARSGGVGGACFWLNVSMELLSCLHFNQRVAWEPDEWGVDMDFTCYREQGREELWAYRIIYVLAKIANFRASITGHQQAMDTVAEPPYFGSETQKRYDEWKRLKDLCTSWNEHIPRTMHPLAFLPCQTTKSVFPEVWLVKRCAIVARLFYHTAMVLLAQMNPYLPRESEDMHEMEISNSHLICGIAAHARDRGVASVSLRSLAIAAECLTIRREQEEVLAIFTKINTDTGWRVNLVYKELKVRWGWEAPDPSPQQSSSLPESSVMMQQGPASPNQFAQYQCQQQQQQHQRQRQRQHQQQQQHHHHQQQHHQQQHHQQQHHQQQHHQQQHHQQQHHQQQHHQQQQQHHHQQQRQQQQQHHQQQQQHHQHQQQHPQVRGVPQLVNPLMAAADYTSDSHPYDPHYASAPPQVNRHHYM